MLPIDIESGHAYSLLSRRRFLQGLGATGAGLSLGAFGRDLSAYASAPIPAGDGVLVVLLLGGGNDGLNTVVPVSNSGYYAARKGLAIPANSALGIGQGFGLHPKLPYLKALYDQGHLALINGVGYPDPSLSHFDSMATWMRGSAPGVPFSGWLGRWLDAVPNPGPLYAVNLGVSVPLHLTGLTRAGSSIAPWGMELGSHPEPPQQLLYSALRSLSDAPSGLGVWGDTIAKVERDAIDIGRDVAPVFATALPKSDMARDMTLAARLINTDLGVRVVCVSQDGYDTHRNQMGEHDTLMTELNEGISALYAGLEPRFANRTTVLVISEFGRTPDGNDSGGTDHGTSNTTMVIGPGVAGGLYGQLPSFTDLDDNDRFKSTLDFRSIYATVLEKVLQADPQQILGANYGTLPLFSGAALEGVPVPPALPAVPGRLLPVIPTRKLDTREGLGAPQARFSAGVEQTVLVVGVGGVPAQDVTAVVVNVTVTDPTVASFLTVWPTGETKPNASSLNFVTGQTVPNLVMSKVGANGRISMAVNDGAANVIADVVGYFSSVGGSSLVPMTPVRVRDTRNGEGKVGAGKWIDVPMSGTFGLPMSGVSAVVLNVTVNEPTETGFVTVWPTGEPLPQASSLNFTPGLTVPNLVVAKVGANGAVSFFNKNGSSHIIVDLLGWYDAAGTGPMAHATSPQRLLDTRNAKLKVGPNSTYELKVTEVADVPADAKAVVLNMTAVDPSETGFITVYPKGQILPVASNLNFTPGRTVPNQVIATVGDGGSISIYNKAGSVHLIADLVGWYR